MKRLDAFHLIQNVGRFQDCKTPGIQFHGDTIIYGRNTEGKSTLTSILRSLQKGNSKIIEGRKTFGVVAQQKIEIRFTDGTNTEVVCFPSSKWAAGNEDILIFDTQFISDNIFEGEKINFDHQKSLSQIIIGTKGIKLNKEIQDIQELLNELTDKKKQLSISFSRTLPSKNFLNMTLETFCQLPELTDHDEKIKSKKEEIELAKNKDAINRDLGGHINNISKIKLDNAVTILANVVQFNPAVLEKHIEKHWKDPKASKEFLRTGMGLTKSEKDSCVFCGQNLNKDEKDLLKVYEDFFKGEYQQLQKQISQFKTNLTTWNIEKDYAVLQVDLNKYGLKIDFSEEEKELLFQRMNQLKEAVNGKMANLYFEPDTAYVRELIALLSKIVQAIKDVYNAKFPKDQKQKALAVLTHELLMLELSRKRTEEGFKKMCVDLSKINSEFEKNKNLREQKREDLDKYSKDIFDNHKASINYFLSKMGADFQIGDLEPIKKLVGKSERLFTMLFYQNHTVKIDQEDEGVPNFKNTLSESDKRLLAFAFFLSILAHESDLEKKIIVFDDPFSSFDEERKRNTIQLLADIKHLTKVSGSEIIKKPLQKIILTHERTFFREIYAKEFPHAQTLKVVYDGLLNGIKKSKLDYCNITEEFPEDEIIARKKRIKKIQAERTFGENYMVDCRVVLENIFKRKYYFQLKDANVLKLSVRTYTNTLKAKYSEEDYKKMIRLCNDLNIELHDTPVDNSGGDHDSILKDFFDCIQIV